MCDDLCETCEAHLVRMPPPLSAVLQQKKKKKKKGGRRQAVVTVAPAVVHLGRGVGARTTLGRMAGDVDAVLDDGALHTISRRHAVLERSPCCWTLTDLGSLNGTFRNDVRIAPNQPVDLRDGDRLVFGGGGTLPPGSALLQPASAFAFSFVLLHSAAKKRRRNSAAAVAGVDAESDEEALGLFAMAATATATEPQPAATITEASFARRAAELRASALSAAASEIGEECVCFICQELCVEARIVGCGHGFCRACIESWIATGEGAASACCPVCRKPISASPVPCIALANVIKRVLALLPEEERTTYAQRCEAARSQEAEDAQTRKLRESISAAKLRGTRFLSIGDDWTDEERAVFASGVSRYPRAGPARTLYCESVGLTQSWIQDQMAIPDKLFIAATNVGIAILPSAAATTTTWTARKLRDSLLRFIEGK